MKKIVFFFLMTILIASCHQEELSSVPDEPEGKQPVFDLSEEEVLQGCIYVKLKEEPAGEVRVRSIGNTVTTGVKVLDRAASSLKIERMERTFPYAGKFEERTRKEGLHLWYNVWFSKETSATRAATEVAFLMVLKRLYLFLRLYPGQRRKQRGACMASGRESGCSMIRICPDNGIWIIPVRSLGRIRVRISVFLMCGNNIIGILLSL